MKRQDVSAEPSTVANQHEHVVNRCHPRAGVASSADSNFSLPPSRNTRSIRGRVRAVPLHTEIGHRKVRVVKCFWVTCTNAAASTWSSSRTRVLSVRSPPPKQQSRTHREEKAGSDQLHCTCFLLWRNVHQNFTWINTVRKSRTPSPPGLLSSAS